MEHNISVTAACMGLLGIIIGILLDLPPITMLTMITSFTLGIIGMMLSNSDEPRTTRRTNPLRWERIPKRQLSESEQRTNRQVESVSLVLGTAIASIAVTYVMREHILTVCVIPLTIAALSFVRFHKPSGPFIRHTAAAAALLAFNASMILGGGITLPASFPIERFTTDIPSFAVLVGFLPKTYLVAMNLFCIRAWWAGRHLATPTPALTEAISNQ